MITQDKVFSNFFDDRLIINSRFYGFSLDTLNRFNANNANGEYQPIIDSITPLLITFGTEIGDVDVALNIQKGKTMTTNQVIAAFKNTMKEKQGVIANALGGFSTPAYLEFYPHGITEYTTVTKTLMPSLTSRVNTIALVFAGQLGAQLTTLLTGFQAQWIAVRDEQQQQFGKVDDNRTERSQARIALELAMISAVHMIASKFPGNIDECDNFFEFKLLFPHSTHRSKTYVGVLAPGEVKMVLNRSLSDSYTLQIQNHDDNADIQVYLSHTNGEQPNGRGIRVKSGRGMRPKPSELGNLADTFLLVKNMSDVNEGAYLVKLGGI